MKEFIEALRKFGAIHIESEAEIVVKTEPFHTLVVKKEDGYVVHSPVGIFRVRSEEDVIRAMEGRIRPSVPANPLYAVLLGPLRAEIKLIVDGMFVLRPVNSGRDFYVSPPVGGGIFVISTFTGENRMLGDVLLFGYSSADDAAKKLVSILVAITRGEMEKVYAYRGALNPRPAA